MKDKNHMTYDVETSCEFVYNYKTIYSRKFGSNQIL